ncbi:TetR family transcriptional regulator [Nonomuraea sp. NPDC023979]|uniref:TetR/AcrR family transcriptional regulator n=1 Tax=Nonomuraea sp. NPDC023979 TaxID=3154796 RepID=UPI0033E04BF0
MESAQRTGRRPGPSTTRDDILCSAARLFSSQGFQSTSLRQIAAHAGVDPALVRRFYHGKDELFTALVRSVFNAEDTVPALLRGPRRELGVRLAGYVLDLLGDVRDPGPLLGVVRSAVESEHAAAFIRAYVAEEMLGRLTRALEVDQPELRAALTAGQLVGLILARYAVRLDALVAAERGEVIAWVAPVLQRYLTGRVPVTPGTGEPA